MQSILFIDDQIEFWWNLRQELPNMTIYWLDNLDFAVANQHYLPKVDMVVSDFGGVSGKPFAQLKKIKNANKIMTSREPVDNCPFPFVLKTELASYIQRHMPNRRNTR